MISMGTWYYTLGVLPMGISVTLNYMSPLFLGLILLFDTRNDAEEKPKKIQIALIFIGLFGVCLILNPFGATIASKDAIAVAFGVAAAFVAAVAFKDVKILKQSGENEWQMVFYFSTISALIAYPLTSAARFDFSGPLNGYLMLFIAGIFGSIGQYGVSKAFGSGDQIVAASMQYMSVIFSLLISWVALNEQIDINQIVGISVIIFSAIATTYVSQKKVHIKIKSISGFR